MKILYFTATGNSLYVAKSLGGQLLSIPQMVKDGIFEFTDDKIGIVFPVYSWSVNSFVEAFLRKATFHCDYLFAVATYGMYAGGVGDHLQKIGADCGHSFDYIHKVKMVDNYLLGFNMAKQIKNAPKKHIDAQISAIKGDVDARKSFVMKESGLMRFGTQQMVKSNQKKQSTGIKGKIRIENSCTQCGICTKVCPVGNIALNPQNHTIILDNRCFMCFACIQNCPSNAIHIRHEIDKSRFRNHHIQLKEITDANCQLK